MIRKIVLLIVGIVLFFSGCGDNDQIVSLYQEAEKLESEVVESVETISQLRIKYETILQQAPESEFAAMSCYKLGKLNEIFGHYEEAISYYQKLLAQYPQHSIGAKGLFDMAQIYELQLDKDEEAMINFQQLVNFYPDDELAFKGLLRLGQLSSKRKQWDQAVAYFQQAVTQYPDQPADDDLYFRIGDILQHKLEDKERAREMFQSLIEKYPSSRWITYARNRLDELNQGGN